MDPRLQVRVRFPVDDRALSSLHAWAVSLRADSVQPWAQRLQRHALTWVGAFEGEALRGFVHGAAMSR